jgi:hypothetical protein
VHVSSFRVACVISKLPIFHDLLYALGAWEWLSKRQNGECPSEIGARDPAYSGDFLLPASTQSLIQLNQRVQFISLRLRQGQFCRKRVCFVRQNFKVVRCPRFETYL